MTTPPPTLYTEHTYATKHGVALPLRIWQCTATPSPETSNYADPMDSAFSIAGASPAPAARKPWLLWSHGGGFMGGSLVPAPWVLPAFQGWCHVVSYGYRLAPHAGVDDMVADGADAFAWCRAHLPALLDVDIDAYAVGGLSAGGTLALLNAREGGFAPRPRAVLDVYGIADFGDTHFDPKFTGPGYDPGTVSGRYSEGELERAIADRDPSHALTSLAGDADPDAESAAQMLYARVREMFGAVDKKALQQDIRVHVAATSRIMRVLTRRERYADNDAWRVAATAASPVSLVDARFPPTAILHGISDRVVPVEQSARLAKKLVALGVPVKEVYAENSDHCFDFELTEPTFEAWEFFIEPIVGFVRERLLAPAAPNEGSFADGTEVAAAVAGLSVSHKPEGPHVHWSDLDAACAAADAAAKVEAEVKAEAEAAATAVQADVQPADVPEVKPAAVAA